MGKKAKPDQSPALQPRLLKQLIFWRGLICHKSEVSMTLAYHFEYYVKDFL